MAYDDFVAAGSFAAAREKGLVSLWIYWIVTFVMQKISYLLTFQYLHATKDV